MEKCLVDVVYEHQIHAFRHKAGLCEAVQVSPGLAEVEGAAYGTVAEAREPHSAAGASDTEVAADVEEACLCIGSAVGGEHHFPGFTEQGLELSLQFFHRDRHFESVRNEGIFSLSQLAQRSLAYETGRDVGYGDGVGCVDAVGGFGVRAQRKGDGLGGENVLADNQNHKFNVGLGVIL